MTIKERSTPATLCANGARIDRIGLPLRAEHLHSVGGAELVRRSIDRHADAEMPSRKAAVFIAQQLDEINLVELHVPNGMYLKVVQTRKVQMAGTRG